MEDPEDANCSSVFPGLFIFLTGLFFLIRIYFGPFYFLGRYLDIHTMIVSAFISFLGFQIIFLGLFAKTYSLLFLGNMISFLKNFYPGLLWKKEFFRGNVFLGRIGTFWKSDLYLGNERIYGAFFCETINFGSGYFDDWALRNFFLIFFRLLEAEREGSRDNLQLANSNILILSKSYWDSSIILTLILCTCEGSSCCISCKFESFYSSGNEVHNFLERMKA